MNFNEYQRLANQTAIYPHRYGLAGTTYVALGLNGEAGEVAELVKKAIRDDGYVSLARKEHLKQELGDVLWYVSQICSELGIDMSEVASTNIEKLQSRKERGVLQGSGDER